LQSIPFTINTKKMSTTQQFTNLQWQLLQLYNRNISDANLLEIKQLLANYFAEKASEEMSKLWDSNGWSNATMYEWLNEDVHEQK
jgi:hypothetical protein